MATYIRADEETARASLARSGVFILRDDAPQYESLLHATLRDDSRFDRETIEVEPPAPGLEYTGFGSWHRNGANEFHSVLSGSGIVEFMTPSGSISVLIGPGDVMVVHRAEHRYLPLTRQSWIVRFDGGPQAELVAEETGRTPLPWPDFA